MFDNKNIGERIYIIKPRIIRREAFYNLMIKCFSQRQNMVMKTV